jgi:hypothetical protein
VKEFKIGQTVRINTPGESHHGRIGHVTAANTVKVWVDLGDVHWMYFHDEVDTL